MKGAWRSWPPERFVAFLEGIHTANAEVLKHCRIQGQQGAPLARDPIGFAQPPEYLGESRCERRWPVNRRFATPGCCLRHDLVLHTLH